MNKKYEVAIYNDHVLRALQQGDHHKDLADAWADTHYFEVSAASETDALAKMKRKYRPENGFVIKEIQETEGA
ncbi:hypothetical protein [Sneathiella chinensis]|uniref:Uncharacterized protein n=1 Tax=Sneathiella chinensis TaxID=349750 RepID=A0ABQ5U563_9PROT|nr:hypothetical protein [Sneathiella chinensis]GLQ05606.1 hypothetical protein GCM10007924_08270 [Sneathiella chinensis]